MELMELVENHHLHEQKIHDARSALQEATMEMREFTDRTAEKLIDAAMYGYLKVNWRAIHRDLHHNRQRIDDELKLDL